MVCNLQRPTVTTTLKNLVSLYRKQGRNEAADQLDNCAVKIKKDVCLFRSSIHGPFLSILYMYFLFCCLQQPSAISLAIDVVQRVQMSDAFVNNPNINTLHTQPQQQQQPQPAGVNHRLSVYELRTLNNDVCIFI